MSAASIFDPVCCAHCGTPLELHCPHGHPPEPFQIGRPPRVTAPREPHEARCGRCRRELPRKLGRPRRFCDECLTPAERRALEQKRAWGARKRREEPS